MTQDSLFKLLGEHGVQIVCLVSLLAVLFLFRDVLAWRKALDASSANSLDKRVKEVFDACGFAEGDRWVVRGGRSAVAEALRERA